MLPIWIFTNPSYSGSSRDVFTYFKFVLQSWIHLQGKSDIMLWTILPPLHKTYLVLLLATDLKICRFSIFSSYVWIIFSDCNVWCWICKKWDFNTFDLNLVPLPDLFNTIDIVNVSHFDRVAEIGKVDFPLAEIKYFLWLHSKFVLLSICKKPITGK